MSDCRWLKGLGPDWTWVCKDQWKQRTQEKAPTVGEAVERGLKSANPNIVHQPVKLGNTWDAFVCALGEGCYDWNNGTCDWSHYQGTYQIRKFK